MVNYVITTNLDEDVGANLAADQADGDGLSLREAIHHASAGDTILFDASLAGTTLVLSKNTDIDLTKNLTIDGDTNGDDKADITISGVNSRLFDVTSGTVRLYSLNLTNGNSYGVGGGAIRTAMGTSLTISDSTISANTNNSNGGGILADGTLSIVNSTLTGNSSNYGGAITMSANGTATLINTTIDDNSAIDGGGILAAAGSSITLTNSTVTNNSATDAGGGVYLFLGASATFENSVVALNSATGTYKAVDEVGANTVTVHNSVFDTALKEVDSGAATVVADVKLGLLQDNGGTVETRNPDSDSPLVNAGGNGYVPGGVTTDANGNGRVVATDVDIGAAEFQLIVTTANDDTVSGSLATDLADGGGLSLREAIHHAGAGDTITFQSGLGTLFLSEGQLDVAKSLTIDGDTDGDDKADITISGDGDKDGTGDSRIFNLTDGDIGLKSLTLTDGNAGGGQHGGAINADAGALSLFIADSTIKDSYASGGGGIKSSAPFRVFNSTVTGNEANHGGGIYADATVIIENSTVHGNTASGDGGGIETGSAIIVTVRSSTITNNDSGTVGGGILLFNGSTLNIDNSVVAYNSATAAGPDIGEVLSPNSIIANSSIFGSGAGFTIDGGVNNGVTATPKLGPLQDNGGAVATRNLLPDSTLINAGDNGELAGLTEDANGNPRIVGGTTDVGATEFALVVTQNNDTDTVGTFAADLTDNGGLSLREAIAHAGAGDTITFDPSLKGALLTLVQGDLDLTKDVTIDGDVNGDDRADITISGDADGSGSGNAGDSRIFDVNSGVDATLKSLTLANGYSSGKGGAIFADSGSKLTVIDSMVRDSVSASGGGIYSSNNLALVNSTISGNSSPGHGGGIFVVGTGYLTNTTLHDNSASLDGGGIDTNSGTELVIRNSTVSNNSSGGHGGGIDLFGGSKATITNSVISQNAGTGANDDVAETGADSILNAGNSFFGTTVAIDGDFGGNTNNGGNAKLGQLLDHGGTVLTLSPLDGSPLIGGGGNLLIRADLQDIDDDGTMAELLPQDGRGGLRVVGGTVDIGAVEKITNETITGTEADNTILGGSGKDTLDGLGGKDTLDGGSGNDLVRGGDGNDLVKGAGGNDKLFGGTSKDKLFGDVGKDTLQGDAGDDQLFGGKQNDKLFGGNQNDKLKGDDGNDQLFGGNHNDQLFGGKGKDTLKGDAGKDVLRGDQGNDKLIGGGGTDTAVYSGKINGYKVVKAGSKIKVIDKDGKFGTDVLSGVEKLKFGNKVFSVKKALKANAQQPAKADDDGLDGSGGGAGKGGGRDDGMVSVATGFDLFRIDLSVLDADDLLA